MAVTSRLLPTAATVAALLGGRTLVRHLSAISLDGRVAIVTGGSRGLGFRIAQELAAGGARVALCARDAEDLETAAQRLRDEGAEVLAVPCDVGNAEDVAAFVALVVERFGGVDILVNNAGVIGVGPVQAQRLEDFQRAMDVMFWGVVHTTLAALPHLRRSGDARIANITSIGGRLAPPHMLPYAAAKFAATGFSEGLSAELARDGIAVTTVLPGLMRTGSHRAALVKGDRPEEFAWFALGASSPWPATSADRAARRIVAALRRGDPELILTTAAKVAVKAAALAPELTVAALGLVNRLLPHAEGDLEAHPGEEVRDGRLGAATTLGERAAEDLQEHNPSA